MTIDSKFDIKESFGVKMSENQEEQFPLLACAVRVVYSVSAASSKSERVFSSAGNTVTQGHRYRRDLMLKK